MLIRTFESVNHTLVTFRYQFIDRFVIYVGFCCCFGEAGLLFKLVSKGHYSGLDSSFKPPIPKAICSIKSRIFKTTKTATNRSVSDSGTKQNHGKYWV